MSSESIPSEQRITQEFLEIVNNLAICWAINKRKPCFTHGISFLYEFSFHFFACVFCWVNGFESLNHSQDLEIMCHEPNASNIYGLLSTAWRKLWLEPHRHNIYQPNNISLGMLSISPPPITERSRRYIIMVSISHIYWYIFRKAWCRNESLWSLHSRRKINLNLCLHLDIPFYAMHIYNLRDSILTI